jgi:hypothetical protein
MLQDLMNPSYNETLWIELLRWGLVAAAWIAACWGVLFLPGFLKRQYAHLTLAHRHRRRSHQGDGSYVHVRARATAGHN